MRARSNLSPPVIAALAAIGLGMCSAEAAPRSTAPPFHPADHLTGWYGDRSRIDVEIAPSTSTPPAAPLRFRVDRAYVSGRADGLLGFGLDIPTGLPNALFVARISHRGPPNIPRLGHRELIARLLTLDFASGDRAVRVSDAARRLSLCRGAEIAPNLYEFDYWRAPACRPFPGDDRVARFVALYGDDLLELTCSPPQPGPETLGCALRFPFEGFAVRMAFHGRYMLRWSSVLDQAVGFLRSAQYREQS